MIPFLTDKYVGDLSTPIRPPHTPVEDIKFATIIRFRTIDNVPQFNTIRLESFPAETWTNWWLRHKTGQFDFPFEVYRTNENYNHQELFEFKLSLAEIYDQYPTIDARNEKFNELLGEVATKIEFSNE